MRFLAYLRHAFKLTNLTYPYKNSLNYAPVAGSDNSTQKRCFASKSSGGEHNDDEGFQEAFAVMSLLRDNSRKVEFFPIENLEETERQRNGENSGDKNMTMAKVTEGPDTNILHSVRSDGITPQVNPTKKINHISYPSIDTEMTILKKSLLSPSNLMNSNGSMNLSLSTNTRLKPYDTTTIPLHLNTLINGNSDIDKKTIPHYELHSLKVPEFNEYLTSLAANLCSAAVQSGFPSENSRKYSTENTLDANMIEKIGEIKTLSTSSTLTSKETKDTKRDAHIVCVRDGNKGCISPGNAENPPYFPKKPTESEKPQEAKGALSGLGLLDPQLYKKSLKEAETKRKELAKASASCKEKLSLRAYQSKKSTKAQTEVEDPCNSSPKCGSEMKSVKNFESVTESSSPFKCGSKTATSNCGSENMVSPPKPTSSSCRSDEAGSKVDTKTDCRSVKQSESKSSSKISQKISKCSSEIKKPESVSIPQKISKCISEIEKPESVSIPQKTSKCNSEFKKPESVPIPQKTSKCSSEIKKPESVPKKLSKSRTESSAEKKAQVKSSVSPETKLKKCEKVTETSKCSTKPESKPETTLKCSSKSELKLEDACKIPPPTKSKSCGSGTEDPCKVPPITFNKTSDKSASESKCSTSSKEKCVAGKEEKQEKKKSSPASKCSEPSKSKCASKPSLAASKCSTSPSETTSSKCPSKCSSNSCIQSTKKLPLEADDSEKACKRVAMDAKKSCDSEPKNPCKSRCDSMNKPKPKCGRPPKGDTRPKCKKDSKCGSKKPSPCASKDKSESKCGTEMKPTTKPSKCDSKTCAPSPKTSKTEIKPKSTCSSGDIKSKTAPSSEPPKRKLHSLSNFSTSNLIFSRKFSDDCPEKPKGGYKLETERSDEYRRETCDNFSWKSTKPRKKRITKPKNCYPEETQEFCPDTACYRVYAETSGKSNKKKKPKGNKMKTNEALCTKRTIGNPFGHQKRQLSSKASENEEALIEKPHSICTRRLNLPEISDNDVQICVDSVALSDTDIYMFETGGRHTPELTLGNEASGVVTKVGRSICNLKPGDHIVLESGIPCFKCDLCKMGRYNICNNISFKGFLKNHCIHPASFCHKICAPIPLEHAALIPQLALGCNSCYQAGIKPNSNVAIIGSCAKTVCAAICAISMGAENVCVVCGIPETRILVEQFVTQKAISFDCNTIEKGIVRSILASLGTFPDVVINFSANTTTMNAAIMSLRPAGICTVAGFLSECVSYNIMDALMKEIRIIPSFRSKNMFPKAIHLLESGRAPLECLIANCEFCKWNELEGAFKLALSEGNNGPRKAIVKCQLSDSGS